MVMRLICVGGTGAKIAESVVHLTAAGLFSDDIELIFMDQDPNNGNLNRSMELAHLYRSLKQDLDREIGGERALFHTQLKVYPEVVLPIKELNKNLEKIFGIRSDAQATENPEALLMQALMSRAERRNDMSIGFHGRPAVGAAAIAASIESQDSALSRLVKSLAREIRPGEPTDVLIAASVFGGTGASGVPTLARHLKTMAGGDSERSGISIGALLMLNYFEVSGEGQFGPNSEAEVSIALEYYEHLLKDYQKQFRVPLLDSIYLLGASPPYVVEREPEGGGGDQVNPPLGPELLAGLAAAHFQRYRPLRDGSVFLAGRREESNSVEWADIPQIRTPENDNFTRDALASLARFSVAYTGAYYPCLHKHHVNRFVTQAWFQNFFNYDHINQDVFHSFKEELNDYCLAYLKWLSSLQLIKPHGSERDRWTLFDVQKIAVPPNGTERQGSPTQVDLRFNPTERRDRSKIKDGYAALSPLPQSPDLADLLSAVSAKEARPGRTRHAQGICEFADTLYMKSRIAEV